MPNLEAVLAEIDRRNSADPNLIEIDGKKRPYELYYSERVIFWLGKRRADVPETLRIAARGQHVERWSVPRDRYPMDRGGYLRWREELKRVHSTAVVSIMAQHGWSVEDQERVRTIMLKKGLKEDPDVQALEDALCLVFLELQFDALLAKTEAEKMIEIVRKTWNKMSSSGRELAMSIQLSAKAKAVIIEALKERSA